LSPSSKYRIERIIGEGAVGVVFAAHNIELGERVALKFLKAEMLNRRDVVARFMDEAKAACRIKSVHSATVFDVGHTSEGHPFLVMEYLEGHDLASHIAQNPPLSAREVAEFGMQVCDALAAAHAKGVVHRDIKPENLFLDSRTGIPSIKVLDFGISLSVLNGTVLSTILPLVGSNHGMTGTPLYMSPEQVRSSDGVDSRTDIWSLGVVMFQALTRKLPFQGDSITDLCAAILETPAKSVAQFRPDLPAEFMSIIERCLEKDVERRFQNAAELAMALMPFAPTRARLCAERAVNVLVSAGMVHPDVARFQSTVPSAMSTHSTPAVVVSPSSSAAVSMSREVLEQAETMQSIDPPPVRPTRLRRLAVSAMLAVTLLVVFLVIATHGLSPRPARPMPPLAVQPPVAVDAGVPHVP
jgi:serine/threonine protein kinase